MNNDEMIVRSPTQNFLGIVSSRIINFTYRESQSHENGLEVVRGRVMGNALDV